MRLVLWDIRVEWLVIYCLSIDNYILGGVLCFSFVSVWVIIILFFLVWVLSL